MNFWRTCHFQGWQTETSWS